MATNTTSRQINRWWVLVILSCGLFMIQLDATIVNVAIPSMISDLKASLDQVIWVLNGYILVFAVLLITAGRLGDLFGSRNVLVIGVALFTVSSALCGIAPSVGLLIAARVAQGAGAALLMPQTLSLITTVFPAEDRGTAFGIWGAVGGAASVAGPTLGGLLVTYASWRWIFFLNVPIGILVIVGGLIYVPERRSGVRRGFDTVGVAMSSASLFLVTFGLIEGQRYNWGHVTSLGSITLPAIVDIKLLLALGLLVGLVFLAVWEVRVKDPIVPLSLFRDRNYSLMNWVAVALSFGILGLFLPFMIYLQSVLGFSAIKAGLTIVPLTAAVLPVAPIAGKLADRFGGKYLLVGGLLLMGLGFALFDQAVTANADWYNFLAVGILTGVGMGVALAPMTTVAMRDIEPPMASAASSILSTSRQIGGVLGTAIVGAVLQNQFATDLTTQAVQLSGGLPAALRQPFI